MLDCKNNLYECRCFFSCLYLDRISDFLFCRVFCDGWMIAVSNPTKAGQRFTWSKTWCNRQQVWKAVITGDTVTRLSISIRGRGKIT